MKRYWLISLILMVLGLIILISIMRKAREHQRVIIVQPFINFDPSLTQSIFKKLKVINPNCILKAPINFPKSTYNKIRNRYRADKLIKYLSQFGSNDSVVIGLSASDISTTKGKIEDWGIMGLGFCPGNACIVSTYRLEKENYPMQLTKIAIHELGHTEGLNHCSVKTCLMRHAEGNNHLNEINGFCGFCKTYLLNRDWKL